MKPYYEDTAAGITIYHGDCREVLPTLDRGSIDLVLTDPPFFMPATHYQSRVRWQRAWSDTSVLGAFWATVLDAIIPALRRTGHFLSFCNGESYPVFYPEMYRRFDAMACLVWDKAHFGMGRVWRHQHELIIAARWQTSVFNEDGRSRSDVLRVRATSPSSRSHPVEKPSTLLADLMAPTTGEMAVVLDPFLGGGSTLLAAKCSSRRAVGIEGEERYCEIAAKRLQQSVMRLEVPA